MLYRTGTKWKISRLKKYIPIRTSPKGFSASKCIFTKSWEFYEKLFENFLDFFGEFLGTFIGICLEGFFGGMFLDELFGMILLGEIFWEELFGRNYLFTVPTAEILSGKNARAWVSMDFS